jgi:acetyltransferase-like isoleucine patch superfamily enzyme
MMLKKILLIKEKYKGFDFLRLLIYKGIKTDFLSIFFRKIKLWFYFKTWKARCGRNVLISGLPIHIEIGEDLNVYDNCIFHFGLQSKFKVGMSCLFSYGVLIACEHRIDIGDFVQIGEYTSIRDSTHQYDNLNIPMKLQADLKKDVIIGNDVWIGRGCIVMPGSIIGDGVIVGANSVVKGNLESFAVYAGSPAKLIKRRNPID